jgi:succinyl-CoA synthetase beta subunit
MHLHEFQAKRWFSDRGIPVPPGAVARSVNAALDIARQLGGQSWIIKAQVQAGGRGKAGGIRHAKSLEEVETMTGYLLGTRLVTVQTGPAGLPVNGVLIEQPVSVQRELYLSAIIERSRERVLLMASAAGGMDIERVARERPEQILTALVEPVAGLMPYQVRQFAFGLGLEPQTQALAHIMSALYRLFTEKDASLVEINPLVVTSDGRLLALDAKLVLDDNALYRQPEAAQLRDPSQEDETEVKAQQLGLNYVSLSGNIACMVNGAGLAMATMDIIKLHGGEPANFLDVGGTATAERVAEAFKLILSNPAVKAILVNIFGGIVRCDLIAEGIIKAVREVGVKIPVIVRLEGTNVEKGRALLKESGLKIVSAESLTDAAKQAVAAAR